MPNTHLSSSSEEPVQRQKFDGEVVIDGKPCLVLEQPGRDGKPEKIILEIVDGPAGTDAR